MRMRMRVSESELNKQAILKLNIWLPRPYHDIDLNIINEII